MHRRTLGLLGASVIVGSGLWLACGGSEGGNDLLTATDTEAGTLLVEAGTSDTSTTGNDAASGTDTGTTQQDAGGDGGIDPPDAGPGGTTTVIKCGSTTCAIPAQSCCVDQLPNNMTAYGCAASCPGLGGGGGGGGDTTALKCSGQANCAAGTVCCVRQVNNGATSECKASCTGNQAQLCDPLAAVSGCTGQVCSNGIDFSDWSLPPTYATCGGKGN